MQQTKHNQFLSLSKSAKDLDLRLNFPDDSWSQMYERGLEPLEEK